MTDEDAVKIITENLAALPQQAARMTAENIANAALIWADLMGEYEACEVRAAVRRHMVTSKWLPAPSEVLAIIDAARFGRIAAGGEQWRRVIVAIGAEGSDRPMPRFQDPVTARVVACLGWRELGRSESQVADRARFIDLYDKLAAEVAEDRAIANVPGIARPALPLTRETRTLEAREQRLLTIGREPDVARAEAVSLEDEPVGMQEGISRVVEVLIGEGTLRVKGGAGGQQN